MSDEIEKFLMHERAEHEAAFGTGAVLKREGSNWFENYRRWVGDRGAPEHLAACVFLERLAQAPGVSKHTERLKDDAGRVRKNSNGTPLRQRFYVFDPFKRAPAREGATATTAAEQDRYENRSESQPVLVKLEHPATAMIEAIGVLVRSVIANGGEGHLRASLKRLLPESTDVTT